MIKNVSHIVNNLKTLVPLGTLFVTNVPRLAMPGIEAPDGWNWFDPPQTNSNWKMRSVWKGEESSLSALLTDLSYLMERQYVRATYKQIRVNGVDIVLLRVYVVPCDITGNRFLEEYRCLYRRGKGVSWHDAKYKSIMKKLIAVLDYSPKAWEGLIVTPILIFSALRPFREFHAKELGSFDYYESGDISFHITRLVNNQAFKKRNTAEKQDLEARLTEVYNSMSFNVDRTSDYFVQAQSIKGMKSTLYNYQMESVAKMLMNETQDRYNYMPRMLKANRYKPFFLDTIRVIFSFGPELYKSPRGGILAENMGLGKTCICLALVCLTKLDTATPLERFSGRNFKDYRVLSLMDQCVRFINRRSIPWKKYADNLSESCVKKLKDNPGYFYLKKEESSTRRFSSRSRPILEEEKLLLASTTLIVCPDNLFPQWVSEIDKHVEHGALAVLQHPSSKFELPSSSELIQYDIVLMSVSSFVAENPATSFLTKVYWKRFIIDEGHSMHQKSTRAVDLSKEIKAERRWAVTGTPTAGMTKLHMNETVDQGSNSYIVKRNFNARDDLLRLGALVFNFFQIEPWKSNHDLWAKNLVKPFVDDSYGAKYALGSLLGDLVVRHSSEQIENDVTLPPLLHKPVFLTPSTHNRISVNLFTAVLAVNAVSSEREDRDYMFHPGSKVDLRRLVTNLQRSTFYWSGFSVDDLETMVKIARVCLEKRSDDGSEYYTPEDLILLKKSIAACKRALSNKTWRTVSTIHEMCYYIKGLHDFYTEYFSIGRHEDDISVFGVPQLYSLQKFFFKNRFLNPDSSEEKISSSSIEFWKDYWREATKKNVERVKKNDGQPIDLPSVDKEIDAQEKISLKSSPKAKKVYDDVELIKSESGRISISNGSTKRPSGPDLTRKARILGTASAKLSYMISRLLEHQFNGIKTIVFFEFEDSAYYLSEALDLLGIDYTLYATSVPKNQRSKKIDFFTNTSTGHALIMDLKLASHGLTITAATRVYFLNPVWSRSIEAQAIKRAHRIGQTDPVYVETLVLKGTLEEEMFKRRQMAEDSTVPVADDNQIQEYISKFEFLKMGDRAPYSEFKCPKSGELDDINQREFDNDELLEPSATLTKEILHWNIPVFNKDAQKKISLVQNALNVNVTIDSEPKVIRKLQFDHDGQEEQTKTKKVRFV
jgi:SNF2 family DNA or RNA helicase